ncbi:16S rRNA (adenine(1518)-N(6)/adenine(1519)-N(6))-dimethyltransferase RsmA [Pelagibacteraceae bacterium]|nr:16S rRNA (adenine(1518)-N(6)/adenine(1519)-N(6))-dimethyltransferase RsmA [Pelagibacteraceae bacterium]
MEISTKKSLGQNFIFDKNLLTRISNCIKSKSSNLIIEIGPGLGTLTDFLYKKQYKKIILIEKDIRLIKNLKKKFNVSKVEILNIDAINFEYNINSLRHSIIVGNLPFNVSVDLLYLWTKYKNWPPQHDKMVLMFQKEVANRIMASPKNKSYGKLSVVIQSRYKIKKLLDIPASAFTPRPKVDAIMLEFIPFNDFGLIDINKIDKVAKDAFSQRRKKIKNNLSNYLSEINNLSISSDLRPEDLTVLDYCNIAKSI